jgi:hypothetical protein
MWLWLLFLKLDLQCSICHAPLTQDTKTQLKAWKQLFQVVHAQTFLSGCTLKWSTKDFKKTSGVSWYIKIPVSSNHNYIQNWELSLATSVLSTKGTIAVQ